MKPDKQAVLSIIQKNARLSIEQLAERLSLEPDVVRQIIEEGERDRTIHGYYTVIDPEQMAPQVRAMIEVKVRPERDKGFDRVARKISRFPEVTDVTLISGGYDLALFVIGETLQEVAEFVSTKLAPMDGVIEHSTHFVLKKYKEAGFQLQEEEHYERLCVTP